MELDSSCMAPSTACALLDVGSDASEREIKNAFKRLALRFHPDKNPNIWKQATEAFQLITDAKDILLATPRPFFDKKRRPSTPEKEDEKPSEKQRRRTFGDLSMGAYFGVLGFWVCDVCESQCLTLREFQACECGHKLKVHLQGRCRQCHCSSFVPKLKSNGCSCGHAAHICIFTRNNFATQTGFCAPPSSARPKCRPRDNPRYPKSARASAARPSSNHGTREPGGAQPRPPASARAHLHRAEVPRVRTRQSYPEDASRRAPAQRQHQMSREPSPDDTPRVHRYCTQGSHHPTEQHATGVESDSTSEGTPREKYGADSSSRGDRRGQHRFRTFWRAEPVKVDGHVLSDSMLAGAADSNGRKESGVRHGASSLGSSRRKEHVQRAQQARGPRKLEEIRARLDKRLEHFDELPIRMRRASYAAMSTRHVA